jgi:hypothetical protein
MPGPQPTPPSQNDLNHLRDQFAVALAQAWFTANPSHPIAQQRDALAKSVWEMADALTRARPPAQQG